MEHNVLVSFVCQRCLQPLSLDKSFNQVGEHRKAELSLPLFASPEIDLDLETANFDHFVPGFNFIDSTNGSRGFTMLEDGDNSNLAHHTTVYIAAQFFDIISGNTEFSHPLCEECTDTLLDVMDQHLRMIEDDYYHYKMYMEKLNKEEDFNLESLTSELKNLVVEEEQLMTNLRLLQEEEERIDRDIVEAEKEKSNLERDEELFWREYNKHTRELNLLADDCRSLNNQLAYAQMHLDRLTKTNVIYTTFHVWHKGHFGLIKNFGLGTLPFAPVDWNEINAAWGEATLLLVALARKCNLTFQRYRLVPYGSHSYIEVLADHKELPLYCSGGLRFLLHSIFDEAMVAFLDCLQQFQEEVEKRKSCFNLPYRMKKGKIKDSGTGKSDSITIQYNSEEQWTKALELMFNNLKWVVCLVADFFCNDDY